MEDDVKQYLKKGILILMLMVGIVGCSEQSNVVTFQNKGVLNSLGKDYTPLAGNPNNQYDSVGIMHNRGLENQAIYGVQYGWLDSARFDSAWYLITDMIEDEKPVWCSLFSSDDFNDLYVRVSEPTMSLDTLTEFIYNHFGENEITPWMEDLIDVIQDTSLYETFIDEVAQLEQTFYQDSSGLAQHEKLMFLSTASVARFSYAYWSDTTRTLWPIEGGDTGTYLHKEKKPKRKLKDIVEEDCIGVIEGAAWGFVVGWLGGPIGAIYGSGTGALAGALARSTAEAYRQWKAQ